MGATFFVTAVSYLIRLFFSSVNFRSISFKMISLLFVPWIWSMLPSFIVETVRKCHAFSSNLARRFCRNLSCYQIDAWWLSEIAHHFIKMIPPTNFVSPFIALIAPMCNYVFHPQMLWNCIHCLLRSQLHNFSFEE